MANCVNCSAPLPGGAYICAYCGSRNDVDFLGRGKTEVDAGPPRFCPDCGTPLSVFILPVREGMEVRIDRCQKCLGLFFDSGELDSVLENLAEAFSIDFQALQGRTLTLEGQFRYRKCPVCGKVMNRLNFGARSGVVTDQCASHGTWLEVGELRRLWEWRKAGGHLFHEQVLKEKAERERKQAEEKRRQLEKLKREADRGDSPHF